MMSRKMFLMSSGAFLAGRMVGATSDEPCLRIGVISDVHIGRLPGRYEGDDTSYLDRTLACFSRKNVDGVVIAGDLTDWGLVAQLELVGTSWRKAFPDNRNAAGGKVEKLFVWGNHDLEGWKYETDQVVVSFQNVLKPTRAYDYEVSIEVMDVDILKTALTKHVYSAGCLRGPGADVKMVECVFSKGELPLRDLIPEGGSLAAKAQWKYRYAVCPCNCWGDGGPAITTEWRSM